MPLPTEIAGFSRFLEDLRTIRKKRGISLDDLHAELKVPQSLLEQFEQDGLLDHPLFNDVYLRSLVRNYARAIGIDGELCLTAFDDARHDRYRGTLSVRYLGADEQVFLDVIEEIEAREHAEALQKAAEEASANGTQDAKHPPSPDRSSALRALSAPSLQAGTLRRMLAVRAGPQAYGAVQWVFVASIVGVLVLVVVLVYALSGSSPERRTSEEEVEPPIVAPVGPESVSDDEAAPPLRPALVLGDTIHVEIFAVDDKLDPVRVQVDDDLRRPYWVELGRSMPFEVLNRIAIENKLNDLRITVEGYEYPIGTVDSTSRVVITRDLAQHFLDSLPR